MIHFPLTVSGQYFENTRIAHRSIFAPMGVSYDRLQRALKKGQRKLCGIAIERVNQRLAVGLPLRPDDDGADLVICPPEKKADSKHGGQLLRYPPGESPLERGIQPVQH